MLRRIHDPQRGSSAVEYGAVIILVIAILMTLTNVVLSDTFSSRVHSAMETLMTPHGQAPRAAGDEPTSTKSPSEEDNTSNSESSSPRTPTTTPWCPP